MKLLILTQYFPPEIGAPQNRLYELAVRLKKIGVDITVLTAMPNYPKMEIHEAYRGKNYVYEEMNGLKVHRSSIYVSKNKSIVNRLRNYFSFVVSSYFCGRNKIKENFDFLLCESPPLFLGYSATRLSRIKKAKLIFNVSDLWPESAEKLSVVNNRQMLNMAYRLEEKLYKKSVLVTGQTQGICKNINERFPAVKTYWLPNGVDLNYYDPSRINKGDWRYRVGLNEDDIIFLYAGIIGIAQGLELILKAAVNYKARGNVKFVLMGSGPEKEDLLKLKETLSLQNVLFLDPVTKSEMPEVLKSVNAAIVPLKKLEIFLGAIPSKIFENLAMEVPVILGVDGEAREIFVNKGECAFFYEPEDVNALISVIDLILTNSEQAAAIGKKGRIFVNEHFNREIIAIKFYDQLKEIYGRKN
jgi:glycosyltransferase involved in cell wall biosynthesis